MAVLPGQGIKTVYQLLRGSKDHMAFTPGHIILYFLYTWKYNPHLLPLGSLPSTLKMNTKYMLKVCSMIGPEEPSQP